MRNDPSPINKKILLAVISGAVIIVVGIVAGYFLIPRDKGPIPEDLQPQLSFSPFVLPDKSTGVVATNYRITKAEDDTQILNYTITIDGVNVALSEYTQPPQFTEIPDFKDRFLSDVAQQYATVPTSSGTIYLGRMAKQNNKQLAVMIEKGLLVFMNPDKELDQAQWRHIGDQLEIQKIIN